MTKVFDLGVQSSIDLDTFSQAAASVNLDSEDDIATLAPELNKLSNNKKWMEQFILEGLEDVGNFQRENLYSPQSYILRNVGDRAFLRFAIWAPKSFGEQLDEDAFYSYKTAHNHDFSLLTAGYLGPGYWTSIYRLKHDGKVIGYPGEAIDIEFVERIQLEQGRVILYEAGKDIHIQYEPTDLSISLNLIVAQPDKNIRQLYYDTEHHRIIGYVGTPGMKRGVFFRFAAAMPTNEVHKSLVEIASRHSCEKTRLYAFRALAESFESRESVADMMRHDHSSLVRSSTNVLKEGLDKIFIWG